MNRSPLLGLDIGLHRTGVALSENGQYAEPLTVLTATPPHAHTVLPKIIALVEQYKINTIVIGLPFTQDDAATTQAQKVERLIEQLQDLLANSNLTIPIERINEFHTTKDASREYPHASVDAGAAALILQYYLDHA